MKKYTVIENGFSGECMAENYNDEFYYSTLGEAYEHFNEFPNRQCELSECNYIWIWAEDSDDPIDCAEHWM